MKSGLGVLAGQVHEPLEQLGGGHPIGLRLADRIAGNTCLRNAVEPQAHGGLTGRPAWARSRRRLRLLPIWKHGLTLSIMETSADRPDPAVRAALAQIDAGRTAAARRVRTPSWFHPLLGSALTAMLAALSLRGPAVAIVLVLALTAQVGLYVLYRRLTGLWINLWHVEGMRTVTAAATGVSVLLLVLGVQLESAGVRGAAAVAGLLLGVAYVLFWRWVERRLIVLWSASS